MRTIITLCLVFSVSNVFANFVDGNRMNEWINHGSSGKNSAAIGWFHGYVLGVVDAGIDVDFCLGPNVTTRQLGAIVEKYLQNYPERWDSRGYYLVRDALEQAFPCSDKPTGE